MAVGSERKLFLGARLKRLRREIGLTQARMAQDLDISPSYLNHLERNQRPLTAQILLRLADSYDIDLRAFSSGESAPSKDLGEVLVDPIFRMRRFAGLPEQDVQPTAESALLHRCHQRFSDIRVSPICVRAHGAGSRYLA